MSKKVICNKTFDPEGRNRSNYAQNDRSFLKISKSAKRAETRGLSVPSGPARCHKHGDESSPPLIAKLKKFYCKKPLKVPPDRQPSINTL